jgi:hypothetical protein
VKERVQQSIDKPGSLSAAPYGGESKDTDKIIDRAPEMPDLREGIFGWHFCCQAAAELAEVRAALRWRNSSRNSSGGT